MALEGVVKAAESLKSLSKSFIGYGQKVLSNEMTFNDRTGCGLPSVLHASRDNISPTLFNVAQQ